MLSVNGLFVDNVGGKPADKGLVEGLDGAVVIALIIAQVDIQVDPAEFRPGMDGDMAFAEADDGGESRGRKVMIDITQFMQPMAVDPFIDGGAELVRLFQTVGIGCR